MSYYKITRPQGSNRLFCYGVQLSVGESVTIDNETLAKGFRTQGWAVEEVEKAEGDLIEVEAKDGEGNYRHPALARFLDARDALEIINPQGEWEITRPASSQAIHLFGRDVRQPFITEDYDEVREFMVRDFDVKQISGKGIQEESHAQVEGEDAGSGKPKPRPLTTADQPRRIRGKRAG